VRDEIRTALLAEKAHHEAIAETMLSAVLAFYGPLPPGAVPLLFNSATWLSARGVRPLLFEA
jgi:hypothetical protein